MKKLGCDHITIRNDGINQPIKTDQIDVQKELKKRGYKLYDEIPFGVIREVAEDGALDIVVNQDKQRIEFFGCTYGFGGMFEDSFGETYNYEIVAVMSTSKYMKGASFVEDGHLEDICAYAKKGYELAQFPCGY